MLRPMKPISCRCSAWALHLLLALAAISLRAHPVADDMSAAATRFLGSLSPELRAKAEKLQSK